MVGPSIPSWQGRPPIPSWPGPLSRHRPAPLSRPGLAPPIRSGTSLRQMADWVAGCDEWVAINERWHKIVNSCLTEWCGQAARFEDDRRFVVVFALLRVARSGERHNARLGRCHPLGSPPRTFQGLASYRRIGSQSRTPAGCERLNHINGFTRHAGPLPDQTTAPRWISRELERGSRWRPVLR